MPSSSNKITAASSSAIESHNVVVVDKQQQNAAGQQPPVNYIYSAAGLFPAPLSRSTKAGAISKIRQRFKLLGKFLAKALYDSRMVRILFEITLFFQLYLLYRNYIIFS